MVSSLVYALISISLSAQTDCSVLYFQSAQCEPCRQFEPVLSQLQQQGWDVQKIEAPAQLDLARQYQIKNLPTVVVLSNQREADRIVGVVSFDQLLSRLDRVAARSRSTSPQTSSLAGPSESISQPKPAQPIIRGQSAGAGQAFPMLASNNSGNSSMGATNSALNAQQTAVQLASASQPISASGNSTPNSRTDNLAPPQLTLAQAIARASDATVRIKVEESNTIAFGTGTIVAVHGDEALVLTCGHLFREMLPGSQLSLDMFAGTSRQVNVIAQLIDFKADEEDIALLSIRLPVKLEPVPILPRGEKVQPGQAVFSIGCDHGNNPTRHDTKISSVNRYNGAANIEIIGAPAVGRSGGGLFDSQGRLLGVCNAACKEDNEGIYAGIDVVYQQLSRIGHAHLFEGPSTAASALAATSVPSPPSPQLSLASGAPMSPLNQTPSARPAVASQPAPANSSNANSARWPDEDPRLGATPAVASGAQPRSASTGGASPTNAPNGGNQLTCVLRDAAGNERVITIPQPSPALLQAIEQQGVAVR